MSTTKFITESTLLEELDPQQRQVVITTEGPLLVFAGAGSGKTRSIIHRAAFLIKEMGIPPWKILIVTFTNKAAKELRERLSNYFSIELKSFWVGTFHSICAKILRIEAEGISMGFDSNFTIFDADDSLSLLRKIYKDLNICKKSYPVSKVYSIISRTKNNLIKPEDFFEIYSRTRDHSLIHRIYSNYQKRLRENNSLDFDDLLMITADMLHHNESIKMKYNQKFDYIMIDEYQDTNYAQARIVNLLSGSKGNVCAVGDDDQAIYSWRGATIKNILSFSSDFNNAKIIRLEQNYRSSQQILDKANSLISFNKTRHPKKLWSLNKNGEEPLIQAFETDKNEVQSILQKVKSLLNNITSSGEKETTVILYRTNAQSRMFETSCLEQNIPYKIHGSLSFFQRKEIKDIIAYLRVIVNPQDTESLLRIINFPTRGIGQTTINKLINSAFQNQTSLFKVLTKAIDFSDINKATINKINSFTNMLENWIQLSGKIDVADLLHRICDELELFDVYKNSSDYKDIVRLENITEFLAAVKEHSDNYHKENDNIPLLRGFLESISLWTTLDSNYTNDKYDNVLNLMTLHNAKGLEFDNVFIVGLEEKLLPHQLCMESDDQIEEERRLLYVGMTRAKRRLYLSYARYRSSFYGYESTLPSRFIKEIYPDDNNIITIRNTPKIIPPVDNIKKPFKIGQKIWHKDFGKGVVLNTEDKGNDVKLTINFENCSLKRIMGSYVKVLD